MARIYETIEKEGLFIPMVRSDDEGWIHSICNHHHHSRKEANKCLTRALPPYMKHQRRKE